MEKKPSSIKGHFSPLIQQIFKTSQDAYQREEIQQLTYTPVQYA